LKGNYTFHGGKGARGGGLENERAVVENRGAGYGCYVAEIEDITRDIWKPRHSLLKQANNKVNSAAERKRGRQSNRKREQQRGKEKE